ncbi:MAG: RNA polymerase sigma factor [Candidatus Marinimicrobia bacterium]|nr:RNA polymerase sigma factor [Candidatus Neomarinimicrobiota bacterium]
MEESERELILKAQNGDKMAFAEIMNRYGERAMNQALRFTRNFNDAEDLYQETFLKIYKNIKSFRFESEFFTWLYRIMANIAFSQFKMKKRYGYVEPIDDMNPRDKAQANTSLSYEQTEDQNVNEIIYVALSKLSKQQRTVFIMKHYEGKKIKEIAEILDCGEGTVKRYLFRAIGKLQNILKPYYKEGLI